jgi:hypothetical protein
MNGIYTLGEEGIIPEFREVYDEFQNQFITSIDERGFKTSAIRWKSSR